MTEVEERRRELADAEAWFEWWRIDEAPKLPDAVRDKALDLAIAGIQERRAALRLAERAALKRAQQEETE